jgi:hypothetical protein
MAAERMLDGEAETITRKAIELAKSGDATALRLCLERILPPRKDRPVSFTLPKIESAGEASRATAAILAAVAAGAVTPSEAGDVAKIVETFVKAIETTEIERRIMALEDRANANG